MVVVERVSVVAEGVPAVQIVAVVVANAGPGPSGQIALAPVRCKTVVPTCNKATPLEIEVDVHHVAHTLHGVVDGKGARFRCLFRAAQNRSHAGQHLLRQILCHRALPKSFQCDRDVGVACEVTNVGVELHVHITRVPRCVIVRRAPLDSEVVVDLGCSQQTLAHLGIDVCFVAKPDRREVVRHVPNRSGDCGHVALHAPIRRSRECVP
mmetsp:Transcript_31959/g.98996  ORF Transcript_31959/g.98996 Transcript_31959/m.98996 type:complete len:209 (-) Transcript_31959:1125-1751(-)